MSTYAISKTGGQQVKVEVGQASYVEKLDGEAGSEAGLNTPAFRWKPYQNAMCMQ